MPASPDPLTSADAARRLGVAVLTLYGWLSQSDAGEFQIRGQQVTIEYFQGGRNGQGRIRIPYAEVERLLDLMRVSPKPRRERQPPTKKRDLKHITANLGRPDD